MHFPVLRLPVLRLRQKITATMTLLSICSCLMLTLIMVREITQNMQATGEQLLVDTAHYMAKTLRSHFASYEVVKYEATKHGAAYEQDGFGEKFWHDVVENSLTNLPQRLEAFVLDADANIVAPKQLRHNVALDMRKKTMAFVGKGAGTIDTLKGRATGMSLEVKPGTYYLVLYYFHADFKDVLWARQRIVLQATAVIVIVAIFFSLLLSRHLAHPLQHLNDAVMALSHVDMSTQRAWQMPSDLPPLPTSRHDEIGTLARSFQYMADTLHENMVKTMELTVAREKVEGELRLAQRIQESILPKNFISSYSTKETAPPVLIHGLVIPARDVGGDFFDVFWPDEDHMCFAIGDVSDKGIPAALFMSMSITLLRSTMRQGDMKESPAKALEYINASLCQDNASNMFVTVIVGILNCRSGRLRFANAGHTPPLCLHSDGTLEVLPTHKEMVIASFDDVNYTDISYDMGVGDRLFLYTDGVNEALNSQGQRFGTEALYSFLHEGKNLDPRQLNEFLINKIQHFSEGAPQYDDMTLLNLIWLPSC